jgi:hypothetical protein
VPDFCAGRALKAETQDIQVLVIYPFLTPQVEIKKSNLHGVPRGRF